MGIADRLAERQRDREQWLSRATSLLGADDSVVAAWLWGSEGRGDADPLSDVDLFVAVADVRAIDRVDERFAAFGEVQWCREVPYNAPKGGRYFTVGYPAAVEPLPVDWYWQPVQEAVIGTDTRVLVEKTPIPRLDVETFATFTPMEHRPSPHPDDPVERLDALLVWFWSMFGGLAKKIARRQEEKAAEEIPLLDGVLALALDHVQRPHEPVVGFPLDALRLLAQRMEALHPALIGAGLTPPDTKKAWDSLHLAVQVQREGWRP